MPIGSAMKTILCVAVLAVLVGFILAAVSYTLCAPPGGAKEFLANVLLNVVAEFIGLSVGLVTAIYIANHVAREKLSQFGEPIIAFIQQLREEGKLSPHATRKSVMATVSIISDGTLKAVRHPDDASEQKCRICSLSSEVELVRGTARCKNCRLPGKSWAAQSEES